MLQLHPDPPMASVIDHRTIQCLPRAGAFFADRPLFGEDIRDGRVAVGEAMGRAAEDDELVVEPLGDDQVGMTVLALDQCQVERSEEQTSELQSIIRVPYVV